MNEIVKYHNDLSNQITIKSLTANELNFFMAICSKMKEKKTKEVVFSFIQLKELVKWDNNNNDLFIKSLVSTNKKLIALNFTFEDEREIVQFVLFPTFKVNKEDKTLTVKVNGEFAFLLNNLSSNFTRFELENFTTLNSKYSKYLYKELMKFKTTGYLILTIENFREKLDIPLTYRMTHINQKVLTPAKEELSKILDNFKINKIKKGRSISHIEFYFTPIVDEDDIEQSNIVEIIEVDEIKEYWIQNFIGVNYTKKHKEVLEKLKSNNDIEYVKSYLMDQWQFVQNNQDIINKPAYFSSLILQEKAVYKDYITENIYYNNIDNFKEDKILEQFNNRITEIHVKMGKVRLNLSEDKEASEEELQKELAVLIDERNKYVNLFKRNK